MNILSTKLCIPTVRARTVARERLFRKLNLANECGFVLVSAPAGYGKSTLVSSWLKTTASPAAWISLDEYDNDPGRFLAYLAAALIKISPTAAQGLQVGIETPSQSAIEMLLTPLINQLAQVNDPFWLVLDDYHTINHQAIHQAVNFLVENRPESLHLALITRADPPLSISKFRARSQMIEIRMADLRFSISETSEFLSLEMGLDLTEADLAALETSTEGWIAGLRMAGLSMQGKENLSSYIHSFSGEDRYILDFLFDEVFERQSQEIQEFLLKTTVLDRFCAGLCDAVTGRNNSKEILNTLDHTNLFLISLDDQRKWYRYHHLFGDLLTHRLKLTSPDLIPSIHQAAGKWYINEHDFENAILQAFAGQDFETATKLIEQEIWKLASHNQQAVLNSWLEKLPVDLLKRRPLLCIQRARGYYWAAQRDKEQEWLTLAEAAKDEVYPQGSPERPMIEGYIADIRALIALTMEDIPTILQMGQQALELAQGRNEICWEAAMAIGAAYWAMGDVAKSEDYFHLSRDLARKVSDAMSIPPAVYWSGQIIKQGRLRDAASILKEVIQMATLPSGMQTPIAGYANTKLGFILTEWNDLNSAEAHLRAGEDQCILVGQPEFIIESSIFSAAAKLASGGLEAAKAAIRKIDPIFQQFKVDPYLKTWRDECQIKIWLAEGDIESASAWAQRCGQTADSPFHYLHDLPEINLARVWVAEGRLKGLTISQQRAGDLLARLRLAADQAGWVHEKIKIILLQSTNAASSGDERLASQHLFEAVRMARPGGYVRVFLDEGEFIQKILASLYKVLREPLRKSLMQLGIKAQEDEFQRIEEYIERLLSEFEKEKQAKKSEGGLTAFSGLRQPDNPNQALIEPLSERELEVLRLLSQGCPDKKIAENLFVSRETVHKHLTNIYGKLGVHSRTEAIAHARDLGIL